MRRRLTIAVGSAAAALALGISTTAAMATTAKTWTIKPGGKVTGTSSNTILKDTKTGTTLKCTSSKTTATLKKGKGQTNPLGKISSVTFSGCTGPGGIPITAKTSASKAHPWNLNGTSYSGGVTHGSITGIKATISGTGCSASVAGTKASANGMVTGTYTNSTGILKVSGGNLHIWNVKGCFSLIKSGDPSTFTGSYKISPKQTITSP